MENNALTSKSNTDNSAPISAAVSHGFTTPKTIHPSHQHAIITSDILVTDTLVTIPSSATLQTTSENDRHRYTDLNHLIDTLLSKKNSAHGGKISIDADDFKKLSAAVSRLPTKMEVGGSSASILTTLKNLLGYRANIDFLGVAGTDDINDNLITEDLKAHGIHVDPGGITSAKSAISFIFTHPDGKHTSITYPGNAAQNLKADMVSDVRMAQSNTTFLPISLWSKFDAVLPDTLLQKSIAQDNTIILAMPKQARFDYSQAGDIYKRVIPHADIIVADEDELAHWYKTGSDIELATSLLQNDIAKRDAQRIVGAKPPRHKPVVAFIKHKDDSATVLVSASPLGVEPASVATRYEIPAAQEISGKKHSLGVDDAMYAGFISAISNDMPAQKAGEFAMQIAQTKFLYDSVRIPGPQNADKITQERWKELQSGAGGTFAGIGSAIGLAKTGVSNETQQKIPRTTGQKTFDFLLYPLIANIGVWALSMYVTYHSNFNQNKANWFVSRSDKFKNLLSKVPGLGKSSDMVENLNMVIWSFIDGSAMAPVVGYFESKRQNISRWIDDKLGSTPDDTSVYDQEIKRSSWDILKARATTFALVIGTYFALNSPLFRHNKHEGTLTETPTGSGNFTRKAVESINGFVFDVPAKLIGVGLSKINSIKNWALEKSGSQLAKMAKQTGTAARSATESDARFQLEGIVKTGLFEFVYTSLCTAGLFFIGKFFASKRNEEEIVKNPITPSNDGSSAPQDSSQPDPKTRFSNNVKRKNSKATTSPRSFLDRIESESEIAHSRT